MIRLSGEGPSVEEFDPSDSIDHWFSTDRRLGSYKVPELSLCLLSSPKANPQSSPGK